MKTIKERIKEADKRTLALWYFDLKSKRATYMITFEQFKQLLSDYKKDVLGLIDENTDRFGHWKCQPKKLKARIEG